MSMLDYVKSLVPSFGKDRILDDVSRLRAELSEVLLPTLDQASKYFSHQQFKSGYATGLQNTMRRSFPEFGNDDLLSILHNIFKPMDHKLEQITGLVGDVFAKDVTKEALTYRKANVLRFLDAVGFAIKYTIRALIHLIDAERQALSPDTPAKSHKGIHLADDKFLTENYAKWFMALRTSDQSFSKIKESLYSIPEVVVSDSDDASIQATYGIRLDPLQLNFVSPDWNPIYHLRTYLAEYEVNAINRAKEERKLVEMYLYRLKAESKKQHDAKMDHQIELVEDRLKKIDSKISHLAEA